MQRDFVRTVRLTNPSTVQLRTLFAPLERAARAALRADGVPSNACRIIKSLDVRYAGQSFEINLPLSANIFAAFHSAHQRLYGYADRGRRVEVVNVRLLAVGRGPHVAHDRLKPRPRLPPGTQRVRWAGRWLRANVYHRLHLASGITLRGPALITEFSATTFVPPSWRATVHPTGHLVLTHAR